MEVLDGIIDEAIKEYDQAINSVRRILITGRPEPGLSDT